MLTGTEVKSLRTGRRPSPKATPPSTAAANSSSTTPIFLILQANRFFSKSRAQASAQTAVARQGDRHVARASARRHDIVALRIYFTPKAGPRSPSRSGAARSCTTSARRESARLESRQDEAHAASGLAIGRDRRFAPALGRRLSPFRHVAAFSAWRGRRECHRYARCRSTAARNRPSRRSPAALAA